MFDNDNIKYNIILGTNFLSKTGINLNCLEGNMAWFDCSIPLCPPGGLDSKVFNAMEDMFHIQVEDEIFGEDWLECFATEILATSRLNSKKVTDGGFSISVTDIMSLRIELDLDASSSTGCTVASFLSRS